VILSISKTIRFSVTVFIFLAINLFGLHDFYGDGLFLIFNTYDFFLISLNGLFWLLFFSQKSIREITLKKPNRYIFFIYVLILLVFFTMPLRGDISVIDAIRVGRHYLIIPIGFLIGYDVLKNDRGEYYWKIFKFIAIVTSIQIILNAFSTDLVNMLFPELGRSEVTQKFEYQRNVLLSVTMLFPHIAAIGYFYKIITQKFDLSTLLVFILFVLGASLQGFRSYLIIMVCIFVMIIFFYTSFLSKRNIKLFTIIIFIFPLILLIDNQLLNNQIYGKFDTAIDELTEKNTGSLEGRFTRAAVKQIPMLLEKPFFGWGFIYHNSEYGKSLNLAAEGSDAHLYGIYSVDHGFITVLIQFGAVLALIIMVLYSKYIIFLFCLGVHSYRIIAAMGLVMMMVISLYSHGSFFREFGLLPFAILLGLSIEKK
jgi:hypothetical protein